MDSFGAIWLSRYDLEKVDLAIAYIGVHYREKLSSGRLSTEQHLSARKLQAGLRQRTGTTLHPYLLRLRIDQARALLSQTDLPIKQIVADMGFKTSSHFGEQFKASTALSPGQFRRSH